MSKTSQTNADAKNENPREPASSAKEDPSEPPKCHIHDEVSESEIEEIHQFVCVPAEEHPFAEFERMHYCLFHLPTKDKNVEEFEEIFLSRLDKADKQCAEIEDEFPDDGDKQRDTKLEKHAVYDFRYVWFPAKVVLNKKTFSSDADFTSATFSSSADFYSATFSSSADFSLATFSSNAAFISATFSSDAYFNWSTFSSSAYFSSATFSSSAYFSSAKFSLIASFGSATFSSYADFSSAVFLSLTHFSSATFLSEASFSSATFSSSADFSSAVFLSLTHFRLATFLSEASFSSATFSSSAYFSSATFLSEASFSSATFSSSAYFSSATFSSSADFYSATFLSDANFREATFDEKSEVLFSPTSFQGSVDFSRAKIKGYLYFEAGEGEFFNGKWEDEAKTIPKKNERKTSVFEKSLDFTNIRAEKPERISFNKVRLRPGWSVNTDSRKFVFTDIAWENHRANKRELLRELVSLKVRGLKKPHNYRLLTISFRNLAANAEEFNRYEEASHFRKSAFEVERLERVNKTRRWRRSLTRQLWHKHSSCRALIKEIPHRLSESIKLIKDWPFDLMQFLYRWLSYYGESWRRASFWLFLIWIGFSLAYWLFGGFGSFEKLQEIGFFRSFGYSLQVMTLQRPEPRPLTGLTMFLYGLQTILAPVQAALLALAIRRKFMR